MAYTYAEKIADVLKNADKYHEAYYDAPAFSGPSLYFHHRALETRRPPGSLAHLEYVYATLASWGMHRPGKAGPKMRPFDIFRHSVELLTKEISEAQGFDFGAMDEARWAIVKKIFMNISVMESETILVGHSKVLHHMMPSVVPPIDRRYTLDYLYGNTNIKNDPEQEWLTCKGIVTGFFIPVASDKVFRKKADGWLARQDKYDFGTSVLKVVDTLLIGSAQ